MALGMIEVFGFATSIVVADAMAKAADVKVVAIDKNKPAAGDSARVPLVMAIKVEGSAAAVEAAVANATMDIPAAMIETQQRQMVDDFAQRLQMQGLSLDQYFQFTGMTASAMMDQVKPQAESRIKSSLLLEAIVKAEGIEATEEDFTAEVAKMAEQYKMEVTAVEEMLGEGGKKQVMSDLAIAKAVEFVAANAVEK